MTVKMTDTRTSALLAAWEPRSYDTPRTSSGLGLAFPAASQGTTVSASGCRSTRSVDRRRTVDRAVPTIGADTTISGVPAGITHPVSSPFALSTARRGGPMI